MAFSNGLSASTTMPSTPGSSLTSSKRSIDLKVLRNSRSASLPLRGQVLRQPELQLRSSRLLQNKQDKRTMITPPASYTDFLKTPIPPKPLDAPNFKTQRTHTTTIRFSDKGTGSVRGPHDSISHTTMRRPSDKVSSNDSDKNEYRTTARRPRKHFTMEVQIPTCRECQKQFMRLSDLQKHEKMHSRPRRCPEKTCKHAEHGFVTEKDRDRHVTDKHSSDLTYIACEQPGCTYKTKRSSNMAQHVEKVHHMPYTRNMNQRPQAANGDFAFLDHSTASVPDFATFNSESLANFKKEFGVDFDVSKQFDPFPHAAKMGFHSKGSASESKPSPGPLPAAMDKLQHSRVLGKRKNAMSTGSSDPYNERTSKILQKCTISEDCSNGDTTVRRRLIALKDCSRPFCLKNVGRLDQSKVSGIDSDLSRFGREGSAFEPLSSLAGDPTYVRIRGRT